MTIDRFATTISLRIIIGGLPLAIIGAGVARTCGSSSN